MKTGSVETMADLPSSGQQEGDCCYVRNTQHHWIWSDGIWQDLGTTESFSRFIRQGLGTTEDLRRLAELLVKSEGTKQDLSNAPNDHMGLRWRDEE